MTKQRLFIGRITSSAWEFSLGWMMSSPPTQTPTQKFKSGFSMLKSQEIGLSLVSSQMIFQALQSEAQILSYLCSNPWGRKSKKSRNSAYKCWRLPVGLIWWQWNFKSSSIKNLLIDLKRTRPYSNAVQRVFMWKSFLESWFYMSLKCNQTAVVKFSVIL